MKQWIVVFAVLVASPALGQTVTPTSPEVGQPVTITLPSTPADISLDAPAAPSSVTFTPSVVGTHTVTINGRVFTVMAVPATSPAPPPPPPPTTAPSPDCTVAATIVDAAGGVWTLNSTNRILLNGAFAGDKHGSLFKRVGDEVYAKTHATGEPWARWTGSGWVNVGAEPSCEVTVPPPPPPPDTESPLPPPPADTSDDPYADAVASVLAKLDQILVQVGRTTVPCQITATSTYANGDQRLTVRCAPSGFVRGPLEVVKEP